jgi:MFS family permease
MFVPEERAGVFGWYLLGPLLGPTLGPLFGGIIVQRAGWRWIFWTTTIICFLNTIVGYFFLHESYAPVLLSRRKANLESEEGAVGKYRFEGEDDRPLSKKLAHSLARPFKIILQPIVLIMSAYQALILYVYEGTDTMSQSPTDGVSRRLTSLIVLQSAVISNRDFNCSF